MGTFEYLKYRDSLLKRLLNTTDITILKRVEKAFENNENNPFDETAWHNLGIAATALKRWEIAKKAWHQLGFKLSNFRWEL